MDVVDGAADLTSDWLTAALRRGGHDLAVAGVEVERIADDHTRFTLLLDDAAPAQPGVQADGARSPRPGRPSATSSACTHPGGTTRPSTTSSS